MGHVGFGDWADDHRLLKEPSKRRAPLWELRRLNRKVNLEVGLQVDGVDRALQRLSRRLVDPGRARARGPERRRAGPSWRGRKAPPRPPPA